MQHISHADDPTNFWGCAAENPESTYELTILFGDRGVPDRYRKMHGYIGQTPELVDNKVEWVYIQIHFKFKQGTGLIT